MPDTRTLVMESTTDTQEEMRVGLGLEPETPAVESDTSDADGADGAAGDTAAEETSAESAETPDGESDEAPAEAEAASGDKTQSDAAERVETKPRNAQGQFKPKASAQKRIDKERAKRGEADGRAAVVEAENAALKKRLEALEASSLTREPAQAERVDVPAPVRAQIAVHFETQRQALEAEMGAEPKQDDFADFNEYLQAARKYDRASARKLAVIDANEQFALTRAADDATLAARAATRTRTQLVSEHQKRETATRAKYADYDQVVRDDIKISPHVFPILSQRILRSPVGPEVKYYLGQHPDAIARINTLAPDEALDAVIEIEALLRTPPAAQPAARAAAVPPKTRVSQAPEPTETELGSTSSASVANDPERMSGAEYHRWRTRRELAAGRR